MNQMEKEEFKDRIKAMDAEEKRLALQLFDDESIVAEVGRRLFVQGKIIKGVHAALKMKFDYEGDGNGTISDV